MQLGHYPAPTHVIAHLSDPHLLAGGALQYGVIDPEKGLLRTLERLRAVNPAPQVLVFTGDLADKADPAAYARLRELVEPSQGCASSRSTPASPATTTASSPTASSRGWSTCSPPLPSTAPCWPCTIHPSRCRCCEPPS